MARPKDKLGNKIRKGDYFVNSTNITTQNLIRDVTIYKFLSKGKYITKELLDAQPNKVITRPAMTHEYALNVGWLVPMYKSNTVFGSYFTRRGQHPDMVKEYSYAHGAEGDIHWVYYLNPAVKIPKSLCEPVVKIDEIKMYLALAGYTISED